MYKSVENHRARFWLGIVLLLVPGISAQAEDGEVLQLRSGIEVPLTEDELWKSGEVYFAGVRAPLGAFVLAKRGQDRCAIVIDKIWEEGEDLPPSTWSGGGRKQFASYTAYYRQDGADKLVASNYRSVSGILSRLSPMGPGRLALAKGDRRPGCGALRLHWSYPNWVEFYGIRNLQLAITQISDPALVQFDDPELHWVPEDRMGKRAPELFERKSLCCNHKDESTN